MQTSDRDWPWIKAALEGLGYFDVRHHSRGGRLEEVSLRTTIDGAIRRLGGAGRTKEQAVATISGQLPFPVRRGRA